MIALLTSPEAWAALLTLTALEIVLGIDNVIFLSVVVSRIPQAQAKRARQIGLALALVFRILLLSLLVWLSAFVKAEPEEESMTPPMPAEEMADEVRQYVAVLKSFLGKKEE